jgi:hypothetical protein
MKSSNIFLYFSTLFPYLPTSVSEHSLCTAFISAPVSYIGALGGLIAVKLLFKRYNSKLELLSAKIGFSHYATMPELGVM